MSDVPLNKLWSVAPWLIILLLAAGNAALIAQNIKLRGELNKGKPNALRQGDKVSGFAAHSLRGSPLDVNYTGREVRRVFFFFTPACPYCGEQFAYWRQMLENINGNQFQIIGLVSSTENRQALEAFLRSHGCESLPVALIDSDIIQRYKLSITPTTLVVANDGTVEESWLGKWGEDQIKKAKSVFDISFR